MSKKSNRFEYDWDDDSDLVVDKKSKRKMARAAEKAERERREAEQRAAARAEQERLNAEAASEQASEHAAGAAQEPVDDTMSRVALLCQESRWREAVLLCHEALAAAKAEGNDGMVQMLTFALPKLEYSLRRQQVAALVRGTISMLKKEYLLDVGE